MNIIHEDLAFPELPEGSSWASNSEVTTALEDRFLPAYLARARWFPSNTASRIKPKIIARLPFTDDSTVFVIVEANQQQYLLPLRTEWSVEAGSNLHQSIVAGLHQEKRDGLLRDAEGTVARMCHIYPSADIPVGLHRHRSSHSKERAVVRKLRTIKEGQ